MLGPARACTRYTNIVDTPTDPSLGQERKGSSRPASCRSSASKIRGREEVSLEFYLVQ